MAPINGILILVVASFVRLDDAYSVTDETKKVEITEKEKFEHTEVGKKQLPDCQVKRQKLKIEALVARMNDLESKVNEEKTKREALESQMNDLQSQLTAGEAEREALMSNMTGLQEQTSDLADKVSKVGQQVGFSAYIYSRNRVHPAEGDTIPFSGVHLNQGDHYNASSSVYTCSKNGTYYFSFNLWSFDIKGGATYDRTTGTLVQDGQNLAMAYCRIYNEDVLIDLLCSQSVLTHCNQGSTVWVRSDYSNNQIYGHSERWSTFSGFLLYAD